MTPPIDSLEDASAHWKREAQTGAAILAAIHAGLGLTAERRGGVGAQDVLDRVAQLVEELRREERATAATHAEMRYQDGYECGKEDEREACAKVIDDASEEYRRGNMVDGGLIAFDPLAAAIRASEKTR